MQTPRAQATGEVTNEMWQLMQEPLVIAPRRPDAATANHTEVYLPEQVVIFFREDKPALITHMASGTGEDWCEEVTISPGEHGNELEGTEPLKRGECGISKTPGGVFAYDRQRTGARESALGTMWNPMYFNYGIAIHGANNVPLEPASHGCIRIPMTLSGVLPAARRDRRPGVRVRRRQGAGGVLRRREDADLQPRRPELHDDHVLHHRPTGAAAARRSHRSGVDRIRPAARRRRRSRRPTDGRRRRPSVATDGD